MPRPLWVDPVLPCCGGSKFLYVPLIGYLHNEPAVWIGLALAALLMFALTFAGRCVVRTVLSLRSGKSR